ncbi:MAG: folate family ECF transporter S component [Clostridia bacterium]|nr:folate family ECF transporter S component [Clostridia bacterium]
MKKKTSVFQSLRSLTVAAMLTAISVIIGIFCKNFLNFGNGLFRVTFENLPVLLSGMLFGPLVGGLVGVASDMISYLLSNQVYPPNLIVTAGAFLIGFLSGALSRLPIRREVPRVILSASVAHLVGSVIVKSIGLYQYYGVLVLWRIPLYLLITSVEILLLCLLLRRKSIQRLIGNI